MELAKLHMYDFHYNEMKPLFGKDLHLLYMDTDSLLYEIDNCADPYVKIFQADKQSKFDLSNFPPSHCLSPGRDFPGLLRMNVMQFILVNLLVCIVKCTVCFLMM